MRWWQLIIFEISLFLFIIFLFLTLGSVNAGQYLVLRFVGWPLLGFGILFFFRKNVSLAPFKNLTLVFFYVSLPLKFSVPFSVEGT